MSAIDFSADPYGVRLLKKLEPHEETEQVCPLLAIDGEMGLVVRDREIFWWPLNLIRVVLQPEVAKPEEEPITPSPIGDYEIREGDRGPAV
jgi:hypothetical protein